MDRRQLLQRLGTTASLGVVATIAGCSNSGDGSNNTTTTEPGMGTTTEPGMGTTEPGMGTTTEPGMGTTGPGIDTTTGSGMETTTESGMETTNGSGMQTTTTEPGMETTTTEPGMETTTGPARVTIADRAFSPVRLAVESGTTVEWTNEDDVTHTIVGEDLVGEARDWTFDERLGNGDSVSYTFDEEGIYEYYCDIHGQNTMCGAVLVGDVTLDKDLPCE